MVFSYLPPTALQQCLSVSQLFHAFAAPLLFATIRLHFGCWQDSHPVQVQPSAVERQRAYDTSCLVLCRIIKDPEFASYVRHLHVFAFVNQIQGFVSRTSDS